MAALKWTVQQICPRCSGLGTIDSTQTTPEVGDVETNVVQITCPICNGEKKVDWGYINVPQAFVNELVQDIVDALP